MSVTNYPPYFEVPVKFQDGTSTGGIYGTMLKVLSENMNFTPILKVSPRGQFVGTRLRNGSFTNMLEELHSRISEVIFRPEFPQSDVILFYDTLYLMDFLNILFFVPIPDILPEWMILFHPLSFQIWILIGCAYITIAGLTMILPIIFKIKLIAVPFPLFNLFGALLKVSLPKTPRIMLERFLFILWVLCSYVIITSYEAALVGFLTQPVKYSPINTIDELAKSDLLITGHPLFSDYFETSEDSRLNALRLKWVTLSNSTYESMMKRAIYKQDIAFVMQYIVFEYLVNKNQYVDSDKKPLLHIVKESLIAYSTSFYFARGSPFTEMFRQKIKRFEEMGLYYKWRNQVINSHSMNFQEENVTDRRQKYVTLKHLIVAFVTLSIGYALSVGIFLWEIMFMYAINWNIAMKSKR